MKMNRTPVLWWLFVSSSWFTRKSSCCSSSTNDLGVRQQQPAAFKEFIQGRKRTIRPLRIAGHHLINADDDDHDTDSGHRGENIRAILSFVLSALRVHCADGNRGSQFLPRGLIRQTGNKDIWILLSWTLNGLHLHKLHKYYNMCAACIII